MKKFIISALTLIGVVLAWAAVEKTEIMTIFKNDGSVVEYDVADIDHVAFTVSEVNYGLYVTTAAGDEVKKAVPAVFRVSPAQDGDPYLFGVSSVEATEPADARQGDYAVKISVSSLKMNTESVDLAGGATSGVSVTLFKYNEGEVEKMYEVQKSGTLTTAVNNKSKAVTINLNATYSDGTKVVVEYEGQVVDVTSLEGLNPPYEYRNQGQYFNADLQPQGVFDVENVQYTPDVAFRGVSGDRFDFTLSNGRQCFFVLATKYINDTFNFAQAEANEVYFVYDDIQLMSLGSAGMNQGKDGEISVTKSEDGEFEINLRVSNLYLSSWGVDGGNPAYVVLNASFTVEIPEPEPEPEPIEVENQVVYVDASGVAQEPLEVVGVTRSAEKSVPYNSSDKGDRFEFDFGDPKLFPTFYIIIKPGYIGQKLDFAQAPYRSYYLKYGATEIAASGFSFLDNKVGQSGTVEIVENEDGSVTIDMDFTLKTNGNPDTKERVVANYTIAAPEPEPDPVYENQGQYFNADLQPQGIFDVESVEYTPDASYRGVNGDRFDFTLSNGKTCYFVIASKYINDTFTFANSAENELYFVYDNIQLMSKGSIMNPGTDGEITVTKSDAGEFEINLRVANRYLAWGNEGGTPEYVVLNAKFTVETPEPEPEPDPVYENQGQYFNADGEAGNVFDVTGMTHTENVRVSGTSGYDKFELELSNGMECFIAVKPEYFGQTIDFATAEKGSFVVKYGYSMNYGTINNEQFLPQGINGKLSVVLNEDGSYTIDLDMFAHYINYGQTNNSSKERVILNYTSPAPEPEPEPEPVFENQGQYFNADGEAGNVFDVTGMTHTENVRVSGTSGYDKFELELSNGMECFIAVKPEYFGQTIDFATAEKGSFVVKYGYSMNYGTINNEQFLPQGINGKLSVVLNEDGSYTIDLDMFAHYINYGQTNNSSKERVILNYTSPAPEPEPSDDGPDTTGYTNQGQHFTADGDPESVFTVESVTHKTNQRVNGVAGFDKFEFALSNGMECYVAVKPEYIGQTIDFATADKDSFLIKYGYNISYGSIDNTMFAGQGINGKIRVKDNGDGTYTIDVNVMAHYINYGQTNNTSKEQIILNYTGTPE